MKTNQSVIAKYAVLLFAALCVASAWGDDGWVGELAPGLTRKYYAFELKVLELTADGTIKLQDSYKNLDTNTVDTVTSLEWKLLSDESYREKIVIATHTGIHENSSPDWYGAEHDESDTKPYYYYPIPRFSQGQTVQVKYTMKSVQGGTTYEYYKVFTFVTSGVVSCDGKGWNSVPREFLVSGAWVGDGISKIIVQYELLAEYNDDTYASCITDSSPTIVADMNPDGTYQCKVPFDDDDQQLVWRVYTQRESTSDEEGEKILFTDGSGESVFSTQRREGGNVAYIWTGNGGDNRWANAQNWEVVANGDGKKESYYGYPGIPCGWIETYQSYQSRVTITNSCEIDLEEGTYGLGSGGGTLVFAEGINVRLKNGTLGLGGDLSALGAKGTVVEYCDLSLPKAPDNSKGRFNIGFAAGSTNIFTGSQDFYWNYRPCDTNKFNTLTVFRDGEIKCNYSMSKFHGLDSLTVLITNAVWMIKSGNTTNLTSGIAGRVEFRNGERQARLVCGNRENINSAGLLMMHGTYDIELPRKAYESSYVIAKHLYKTTGFDLTFDVTDCAFAMKAPILTFLMLDEDGYTSNVMTSITNSQSFTVYAAGRSDNDKTKRERNARLEWDETAMTLYYVQDSPVKGMRVIVR